MVDGDPAKVLGSSAGCSRLGGMALAVRKSATAAVSVAKLTTRSLVCPPPTVGRTAASQWATSRSRSPAYVHLGIRPYAARAARS
jgi:hypothetical protein